MPSIRTLTMIALMCAAVTVAGQTKAPIDAYKAYLDAASRATTPDTLYPFISKDYRGILEHAPKTEVAKMIAGHVAKQKLTNIKVTSEKIVGSKAELQMTATTGDGRSSSGSATLLNEGGEWKVDEDAWATPTK